MNNNDELFIKNFDLIVKNNMLTAGIDFVSDKKSIGIAVSGGADSVSLLVSLSHLSKEFNVPLRVISINHNLREEKESVSDVKYVEFLCNEIIKTGIDLKFFAVNFPRGKILEIAEERNKGVEEAARFLRYKAFDEFFINENVSCVCLAHNLNDNIETVLMRFLQGSSFEGLSGIKFVREKFVRPLLNISRLDIENYLKLQNIKWQTDKTNYDNKYLRNKIRLDLIPFLDVTFPGWKNAVLNGAEKNAWYSDVFADVVNEFSWNAKSEDELFFDFSIFKSLKKGLQLQLLYKAFLLLNVNSRVPFNYLKNILDSFERESKFLIGDLIIEITNDFIFIKKNKIIATENGFFAIIEESGSYDFPFGTVTVESFENKAKVCFDSVIVDNISFPFVIRTRQLGDCIETANGDYKDVADVFSSWHIGTSYKDKIPLVQELETAEQNIIAIVGSVYNFKNWIVRGFYE